MTQAAKIKILAKALRYYQRNGTRNLMRDNKGRLLVENGFVANHALHKTGLVKRKKPIEYYDGRKK